MKKAPIFSAALVLLLGGTVLFSSSREPKVEPTLEEIPIYISTMTHMEGIFKDDVSEKVFDGHVEDIRFAMDLFDEYGAKLTIESEQSFARANVVWGLNFLQEIVDRGHGVGTHVDGGLNDESFEELVAQFKENKQLVDDLVGPENNRGLSGGTSAVDWVRAAAEAGFEYMDAITALAYLSMDESVRPEGWTDEYIKKVVYHDSVPVDFAERIYPLSLKDAQDLESDEDAVLVVMLGEMGELPSLAEDRKTCGTQCVFESADVQAVVDLIEEANDIRDSTRFTRLNMHIPARLLTRENEVLLRELLSAIQVYTDNGTVKWATQGEAYDAYVDYTGQ